MAWAYKGTVTITGSSVLLPSTQTNFPVLIKLDSVNCTVSAVNRLKTVANGGAINNTGTQSGGNAVTMPFDLAFYSDSGLITKIPWEIKSYDGTNGVCWIRVLITSCALSTVFYFGAGDAAVNTQQNTGSFSPSNVWNTNIVGSYLLPDGTTLQLNDSTSGARNLTNNNTATAIAGQADGAASFVRVSNQFLSASGVGVTTYPLSISAWAKLANTTFINGDDRVIACLAKTSGLDEFWISYFQTGGVKTLRMVTQASGVGAEFDTSPTFDTSWHHIVAVWTSSSTRLLYYDGVSLSGTATGSPLTPVGLTDTYIGGLKYNTSNLYGMMDGAVEDVQIFNITQTANWITAEYNTGLVPQTFSVVSLAATVASSITNRRTFTGNMRGR